MPEIDPKKSLERFFLLSDKIQSDLSQRWREHTNRRTTIALIAGGIVVLFFYLFFVRPPDEFPINSLVTIPEGSTLTQAANILKENSIVRSTLLTRVVVTAMGYQKNVHAGDYLFKEPENVFEVARSISLGRFGLEPTKIRVHEGATTAQMAKLFRSQLQRFDAVKFISEAQPMEGYLFPDTYFFLPNATEETVIQAMRENFDQKLQTPVEGSTTVADLIQRSGKSLAEVITMASILEREAHNMDDRRMIAGVLYNRLRKGMLLQVDATFLYTLGKGTFQLTMADLTSDSPYNTYKHPGLPPTPIGSPSLEAIIAAVTPTKNSYLYFLADNEGVTHFCKDYACQLANKERYF